MLKAAIHKLKLYQKQNDLRIQHPDLFLIPAQEPQPSPLQWLGSKTELYELLVALDKMGSIGDRSGRKAPLSVVLEQAEHIFNDTYTDSSTINKNVLARKRDQTIFLERLRNEMRKYY